MRLIARSNMNAHDQVAKAKVAALGLRILVQQLPLHNLTHCSKLSSHVVLKSRNLLKLSSSGRSCISEDLDGRYLMNSCCLCRRKLRADKDVYMYKGDQGFCSVECRSRQIYLDDIADLEASTRKILASSYKNGVFKEDFRRHYSASQRNQRLVL